MYFIEDEYPQKGTSKKKTKKWCKGRWGVRHKAVVDVITDYIDECHWYAYRVGWDGRGEKAFNYRCRHGLKCTVCGKIIYRRRKYDVQCPDMKPLDENIKPEYWW